MKRLPLLLSAVLIACSTATGPGALGTWGGPTASLTLSPDSGSVGYACGAGTIAAGWTLDRQGRFAGTGAHYLGGGPAPATGRTPHPASYSGQVRGDVFDLQVYVPDLQLTLGPFRMLRGGPVVTEVCL